MELITEFKNIFDHYDKKKKGTLDRDQFLKSLSGIYSYSDCIERLRVNGFENAQEIKID